MQIALSHLQARADEIRRQIEAKTAQPQTWKTRDDLWQLRSQLEVVTSLIVGEPEGRTTA